jgi:hypothetical protein
MSGFISRRRTAGWPTGIASQIPLPGRCMAGCVRCSSRAALGAVLQRYFRFRNRLIRRMVCRQVRLSVRRQSARDIGRHARSCRRLRWRYAGGIPDVVTTRGLRCGRQRGSTCMAAAGSRADRTRGVHFGLDRRPGCAGQATATACERSRSHRVPVRNVLRRIRRWRSDRGSGHCFPPAHLRPSFPRVVAACGWPALRVETVFLRAARTFPGRVRQRPGREPCASETVAR